MCSNNIWAGTKDHRHRPRLGHARRAHHPRPREGQGPAHPARLRHLHARTRQARARSGRRRRHRGLRPREDRLRTPRRQGRHAQGPRQRRRLLQGRHANGLKNHGPRMSIPNVFRLLKKGHPQTKTSAGALPSSQETASKRLQRGCKRCLTSNSRVTQAENTCN